MSPPFIDFLVLDEFRFVEDHLMGLVLPLVFEILIGWKLVRDMGYEGWTVRLGDKSERIKLIP